MGDPAPAPAPGGAPGSGDKAPLFCLDGTVSEGTAASQGAGAEGAGRRTYCLEEQRGSPVVLVFYPADGSPVCTQQLRSYNEDLSAFASLGATVWCLSPQDIASHERFAAENHLALPLLADTGKKVGAAYGILGPLGFYRRSVFVVDAQGVIRFARRSLTSMTYLPADRLIQAVRSTTS